MSKLFGPVVQQGYVVPDLEAAIAHWLARGIGPFFVEELRGYPGLYRGETVTFDLDAAFSYSGDQQFEVIQPRGEQRSIYSRFLHHHPTGGLQHLAVWVDDIDETLASLERAGRRWTVEQRYGDRHAYIDCADSPGVMIQLMAHTEANDALFDVIARAAERWDGETNPVRKIDWSSGKPVAPEG